MQSQPRADLPRRHQSQWGISGSHMPISKAKKTLDAARHKKDGTPLEHVHILFFAANSARTSAAGLRIRPSGPHAKSLTRKSPSSSVFGRRAGIKAGCLRAMLLRLAGAVAPLLLACKQRHNIIAQSCHASKQSRTRSSCCYKQATHLRTHFRS